MLHIQGSKASVTKEGILEIANKLNISIPSDVIDFYIKNNGGFCERNTFFIGDEGYKVNEFLSFGVGESSIETSYKVVFIENKEMPDYLVPFAVDAGGDYFCFDTSRDGFGRIFFFESEYYDEPERSVVYLAKTFSDFISKLEIDR